MGFEVAYSNLGCVASVASWWHQFHIQFACVTDVILHIFRHLIVKDMFLGDNAGLFQLDQECILCLYHLGSLRFFMGLTRMALLSISTITMMYFLPCRDQMYVWVYTLCTFLPWRCGVLHVSNGTAFALMDRTFFFFGLDAPLQF
jgi:hypothetical protein